MQVVVATTEGGAVCGGYNPAGWIGLGDHRDSIAAFLFTWPNGDTAAAPLKLKKVPSCSAPAPPSQPLLPAAALPPATHMRVNRHSCHLHCSSCFVKARRA